MKDSLRKIVNGDWHHGLAIFLLNSHITVSTTTGTSPAELLMGRRLQTCLNQMHPDHCKEKQLEKDKQFAQTDWNTMRSFKSSDPFYVRIYGNSSEWIPVIITEATGPVIMYGASINAETPDVDK